MLRTEFKTAAKRVAGARLYVTARGIYEIFLNGRRVGDDYYNPGLTQYNITHLYQTYDVTDLIRPGDNAMGAMLGEGWWSGQLSFGTIWNHFGDRQSLLGKLVVSYEDGSSDVVTTNPRTWKYSADGPLVYGSLNMGEIYDATKDAAIEGWSTAAYDDRKWKSAASVPLEGTAYVGSSTARDGTVTQFDHSRLSLVGQIGNNAGVFKVLTAQSVKEVRKGVYVYDMGQNIVGVPRLSIANGRAGAKLTLRYAEMLYPDLKESGPNVGMIMTENYRAALSQDVYTMKSGSQVFQPRFTSHGYQYIEITGVDAPLPLKAVEGLAISSVRELTADYKTSSAKVNKLWSNLVWSNIDNFLTIPTDCPQRNERMGWSGDISVFSPTATYVSNANQFLDRHMLAMRDVQAASGRFTDIAPVGGGFGGVLWGSAGIVVPWEVYQQYDDVGLLRRHYPAMVAYVNYLETTLDPKTGLSSDGALGDWLGPQNNQLGTAFLVTAYHAYDLGIMAKVAKILGHTADAERFTAMYEKRKAFFNATFVNPDKRTIGLIGGRRPGERTAMPAEFKLADTQTSYAVPLAMGLFSDENIPHMVRNLAEAVERENKDDGGVVRPKHSLMTGFIGTAWISKALSDHGHSALAYRILQNNKYPSWLYAIDQGATSIWERLNGYTVEDGFGGNNSMNSFNHYSFGAVGQWMMAHSLGIERDQPGFKTFILQPEPDPTGGITSAEGHYDSMYGRIASAWAVKGGILTYRATVPANTTATAHIPAASEDTVKEGGRAARAAAGVTFVKHENGKAVYRLEPGSYEFSSRF
jgi:alpha-L-rhamnosidase